MKKSEVYFFVRHIFIGIAIGGANIIPGLSGSTIALLLNVFCRLIESIKSIDFKTIRLLLYGRFREFSRQSDFRFLLAIFIGVLLGGILLARILGYLLVHYQIGTWAFFFGLVLASVFFVGKRITCWSLFSILAFFLGTITAFVITTLPIAHSNASFGYLLLCGIIAIFCMILPGLSGSYVLILLGNYQLILLEGIGQLQFNILLPFVLGAFIGVLAFSHIISYLLQKYYNQTISVLCGFILGSLYSLWPWKREIVQIQNSSKVIKYEYFIPQMDFSGWTAIMLILLGAMLLILLETAQSWLSKYKKFPLL